jgi:hypothetical protein
MAVSKMRHSSAREQGSAAKIPLLRMLNDFAVPPMSISMLELILTQVHPALAKVGSNLCDFPTLVLRSISKILDEHVLTRSSSQ